MRILPRLSEEQVTELTELAKETKDIREFKRVKAVLLLNSQAEVRFITTLTDFSRSHLFHLRHQYVRLGITAVKTTRKGEPKRLLTKKQLDEIITTVKTKRPEEEGFSGSDHWTTSMLARLIELNYGVTYKSRTSYYLIFKEAKFTYHKPGRVYQKHDEKKAALWREEMRKRIQEAREDDATVILCEDEMKLSTQTTFQKIWLPANEYPHVEVSNTKESRSIYGFLNVKTGQEHAFKAAWQNMGITKKQLQQIRRIYPLEKILLLWDGPGHHRGKEVSEYIKKDGDIEVIYFPPYSPEENPQEHVWREGRKEVSHNHFIENIDKATNEFVRFLNATKFPYNLPDFSLFS